jgi:hypothetical protein
MGACMGACTNIDLACQAPNLHVPLRLLQPWVGSFSGLLSSLLPVLAAAIYVLPPALVDTVTANQGMQRDQRQAGI